MIDWNKVKHIHFVGIKGVAMTSLAVWAKQKGYNVSGSDVAETFPTDSVLSQADISPRIGFGTDTVDALYKQYSDTLIIIFTGAHNGKENPQVRRAEELGISVVSHGKALGEITRQYRVIAVSGCHGKTTTTAMIAAMMRYAGFDPSYCIGSGNVRGLGLPGHAGTDSWFIVEADEYVTDPKHDLTPRFLWLTPEILVITSIDYDHPDVYPSLDHVANAYLSLTEKVSSNGCIFWNGEISANQTYLSSLLLPNRQYSAKDIQHVKLSVPGYHNRQNAAAAFTVGTYLNIPKETIAEGLLHFKGAARRFDVIGEKNNCLFVDDYAHHPQEIKATLSAAKEQYPDKRIIAVFQPHTFSRTQSLLSEFAVSFSDADTVVITGIYASARESSVQMTAADVAQKIMHKHVFSAETQKELYTCLDNLIKEGDTVVFMGAGDIGAWGREYFQLYET